MTLTSGKSTLHQNKKIWPHWLQLFAVVLKGRSKREVNGCNGTWMRSLVRVLALISSYFVLKKSHLLFLLFNRRMAPDAGGRSRQCQGGVFVGMRGRGCCSDIPATVEKLWEGVKEQGRGPRCRSVWVGGSEEGGMGFPGSVLDWR